MLAITAQVSFYPLRQESLTPSIKAATEAFDAHGVEKEAGPMRSSTSPSTCWREPTRR